MRFIVHMVIGLIIFKRNLDTDIVLLNRMR
jgi:hypothetical protein